MESTFRDTCPADLKVIETFGAGADGPVRWDAHRARLDATCRSLGASPDLAAIDAAIAALDITAPTRVRLTVDLQGVFEIQTYPAGPTPDAWCIGLADQVVDARDPWFQVKTSQRAAYDNARANLPDGIDELVFVNQHGHVTEGTITNIFVEMHGILRTPPVNDGVLPGILRAKMIADGRAEVGHLTWDDVMASPRVYVGNSLRGLIKVRSAGDAQG